jgi:hypothetical protein
VSVVTITVTQIDPLGETTDPRKREARLETPITTTAAAAVGRIESSAVLLET